MCGCSVSQSCLTLCNSVDCSLPGSSVHGILQARTLTWVAIPFSWVGGGGNLPEPGIKPGSSALQTNSSPSEPPGHLEKETILTAKDAATHSEM